MFSTICLLFFLGFIFWMNTSKRIVWPSRSRVLNYLTDYPLQSRWLAAALFVIATWLCAGLMGLGSGLFAAVVILMTVGSVAVLFFPFRYFGARAVALLYLCGVLLETFF
jgi:hypothetical protein